MSQNDLATKGDLKVLKKDLTKDLMSRFKREIKDEIHKLRTDIEQKLEDNVQLLLEHSSHQHEESLAVLETN